MSPLDYHLCWFMAVQKFKLYLQNEGDRPRAVGQLEFDKGEVVGFELGDALLSTEAHTLARFVREATLAELGLDKLLTDNSC